MKLNTKSLADVTLGTPLLTEGTYFGKVLKADVKQNSKKTGNNLAVEVQVLDQEVVERDSGKVLQNTGGFRLFRYISLVPTETYDPNRNLKELAVACGLPEDLEDLDSNDLLEKVCKVVIKKKPADGQYAEGNDISGFKPVGEDEIVP
jgi:hypothetical protein